jgi:16S rRNA (cytosine967-C5)-methyltransferase
VYSTCTLTRRENADVIRGFLASESGSGFTVASLANEVPAAWREFVTEEGWFQSVPRPGGPDGHFVARLRRA